MSDAPTCLVTGGGAGIGAGIARHLAARGAAVVVAGRTVERCEALAADLPGARAARLDVTDPGSIAALAAELGPVAWLVNNAGIARAGSAFGEPGAAGPDLFDEILAVNLHGARRVVDALLPGMRAAGTGRIVNVASSAALRGYRGIGPYCASKHALLGYTRAAALELEGSGVTMGAVCPHFVDSPSLDEAVAESVARFGKSEADVRAWYAAQNPGGRLVTIEEVAAAVAGLLESDANGVVVELDGSPARELERIA